MVSFCVHMASTFSLRNNSNYSNDDLDNKVYGFLLNNRDENILGRSDFFFVRKNTLLRLYHVSHISPSCCVTVA